MLAVFELLLDEAGHYFHIDFGFCLGHSTGKQIGGLVECSPFKLTVRPGPTDPLNTTAKGAGLMRAVRGEEAAFVITACDASGKELGEVRGEPRAREERNSRPRVLSRILSLASASRIKNRTRPVGFSASRIACI